jgi:hypothetical protein
VTAEDHHDVEVMGTSGLVLAKARLRKEVLHRGEHSALKLSVLG